MGRVYQEGRERRRQRRGATRRIWSLIRTPDVSMKNCRCVWLPDKGDQTMFTHTPVLLSEVLEHLQPEPNRVFVDGTVGLGGHAEIILERILPVVSSHDTDVHLLAIDKDQENLAQAKTRLARF